LNFKLEIEKHDIPFTIYNYAARGPIPATV